MSEKWDAILAELERRHAAAGAMGGEEKLAKREAAGKGNARARMAALFDEGIYREIGALTGGEAIPADALVAGFGMVDGRPVLAGAEDASVMGGSIGDAGSDKRYRLTQLAMQERVPLVFMLDGAGHRLTNEHSGRRPNDLQGLAELSGHVPMVTLVLGPSAGHGALTAPLSDYVVMSENGSMFVAGPPIVKAAIGQDVTKEELGGPPVHLATGVAHEVAADDAGAIALAKHYLSYFTAPLVDAQDGDRRLESILDLIDPDPRKPFDAHDLLDELVDADSLFEVRPRYGRAMISALARMEGRAVAIVANNPAVSAGAIDADAARKATEFLRIAEAFGLATLFLTDTPGVLPGTAAEKAGALRAAAEMFRAQHALTGPKIHVTLRKAFGFGSSVMAMNPFDNQTFSIALPAATLGAMPASAGADAAKLSEAERAKAMADQAGGAYAIAEKMGFDAVIDPRDLRNAILSALRLTGGR